jgi:hypothetical protein
MQQFFPKKNITREWIFRKNFREISSFRDEFCTCNKVNINKSILFSDIKI